MTNRIKSFRTEKPTLRQRLKKFLPKMKYAAYFLGLVALAFVLYELLFMVRITAGISVEKEAPKQFVVVEIVNASGDDQTAEAIAKKLTGYTSDEIKIRKVYTEKLDRKRVEQTLIVSRDNNRKVARLVAERAGLEQSEIVYRAPLENDMFPNVTLILGENVQELLKKNQETEES